MPRVEWDTSPVRSVETVVRVDGVVRPHVSVTWGQDLASVLPEQVAAVGKFAQRSGSITWDRPGVNANLPSPWSTAGGWVPAAGQAVTVDAVDGAGHEVRVFTGLIDSVDGDSQGGMSSKIVDRIDDFNRTVRVEALTEIGAPWKDDGSVRYTAPTPAWVVNDILRQCGYHATPPTPSGVILDAPLQGTVYTYAESPTYSNAQLLDSQSFDGAVNNPQWTGGGEFTGIALHNARVQWAPYTGTGSGRDQLRVSLVVHPNHSAPAQLRTTKTNGANTLLQVDGAKRVTVGVQASGGHNVTRQAFNLPQSTDIVVVSAIYRGGTVEVVSSAGQSATFSLSTPVGDMAYIDLTAEPSAAISGAQVSDPGADGGHVAASWVPSAIVRYGWHAWLQKVAPSVRDENAKAVLEEFAQNLLTPVWLDEYGVARVSATNDLFSGVAAIGVDTLSTVADMSWSYNLLDIRDRVEVSFSDVSVSMNTKTPHRSITVYESGGVTVTNGEQVEEFVNVPDDEEWLGVDVDNAENMNYAIRGGYTDVISAFNSGVGSYLGAMEDGTDANGVQVEKWMTANLPALFASSITPWAFKWSASFGVPGALRVPETGDTTRRFWGLGFPLIRGTGRIKRTPKTVVRGSTNARARVLTHDMGRWCTQQGQADHFATWIHSFVSKPHPVVHGLVIRFDPRVNVGSVIQIDSRQLHGVAIQALVTTVDHDPQGDTSSLVVRVIETRSELGSYNDLKLAWNGASYSTLQALWASINGTYDTLKTDPLWKGYEPWGS